MFGFLWVLQGYSIDGGMTWLPLPEQNFRNDKWSVCFVLDQCT
jgi:hypothetical protein